MGVKQLVEAIKKIRTRRATKEEKSVEYYYVKSFNEPSAIFKHKSRGKKGRLSLSEKIGLIHDVLCNKHT